MNIIFDILALIIDMAVPVGEIPPSEYFRIEYQDRIPECERIRRSKIKKKLEEYFEIWQISDLKCWYQDFT
jgi:hypothetical protein